MAVTGVLKKCADCGTVFVAENPASKYCPCCSARRNIPGPARGNGYRKPPPDALTLDVRAADAAGLSYGVWRAREDDRKRKAKEAIHRKIEERKKKHRAHQQLLLLLPDGKHGDWQGREVLPGSASVRGYAPEKRGER